MSKLVRWIHKHLAEDLRLETLANRTTLSKHDFVREFTRTFGIPPGLFVKNLRFNEARRRLLAGEKPVTVARAVGFDDTAYFIQEFRRRYGSLPDDYQHRFELNGALTDQKKQGGGKIKKSDWGGAVHQRARPMITSFTRCIRHRRRSNGEVTNTDNISSIN